MRKWRLKTGKAAFGAGKNPQVITAGQIVELPDDDDLAKRFPDSRWEEIIDKPADTPAPAAPPAEVKAVQAATKKEEEPEEEVVPIGEDVTDDFEKTSGHKVFKDGAKYFVTTEGDQETPLNPKALKKNLVQDFLDDLQGE